MALYTEYVLTDRTTADKKALRVNDRQLEWVASVDSAQSEPIVLDKTVPGSYWKIYIDDGQIGFESTATVQDDVVVFQDISTAEYWELEVKDGQLFIENEGITIPVGAGVIFKRRRR